MLPSLRSTYNKTDLIQAETKILVLVIDYYLTPIVFFVENNNLPLHESGWNSSNK